MHPIVGGGILATVSAANAGLAIHTNSAVPAAGAVLTGLMALIIGIRGEA